MSTRSKEMLEFNVMDHVKEIAAPFSGMNQEYEKIIREYHKVYLDNSRTEEYKRKQRARTANAVYDLVNDRVRAAKEIIENIKQRYTEPSGEIENNPSEKLFNFFYWKELLPFADYNELQQLYTENKNDPLFEKLFYVEMARRKKEQPDNFNLTEQEKLIAHIERKIDFPELNRIETTLNFVANTAREHFNPGIEAFIKSNRKEGLYPRSIAEDLNRYPVLEGPTYRPLFKLPDSVRG